MIPLRFYATAPYSCSYLPDEMARSQVATPHELIDTEAYSSLIQQGFRRSGLYCYRPYCDHCQACLSCRVLVDEFTPNRTQRRLINKTHLFSTRILEPTFSEEHYQLYQRYQKQRHPASGMDNDNREQYEEFLIHSYVDSRIIEHRDALSNELKIVSLIDIVNDGISAVYTFYDPDNHFSYGTWNILWQINFAKMQKRPYLYLGYWIKNSPKMAYKNNFQPLEIFSHQGWDLLTSS